MKCKVFIWLMCLGGILSACGSVELLTFDQLNPADITFPTDIKSVGVVNNMPYRTEPKKDILTFGVLSGEGKNSTEALAGVLADSKYFEEVVISDSAFQPKTEEPDSWKDPLTAGQVKEIADQLNVDLLVVYDRLWIETSRQQVYYPGLDLPYPTVQAKITPVVNLYLPNRSQPMATFTVTDSLYWDTSISISEYDVLDEASSWAATTIGNKIVPSWSKAERLYFSGGCVEMRDASIYVHEGEWNEARHTWQTLYERLKKGKTKAKAAYNIALSYEMEGNVEEAEKWLTSARSYITPDSDEDKLFQQYLSDLSGRKNTIFNLNMQMKRFNNNF